jgi:hypothetical protein
MQYKLNYVGQSNLTPQSSSGISAEVKGGAMIEQSGTDIQKSNVVT